MIAGLDSQAPPSDSTIAQAKAHGVRLWGGYIATRSDAGVSPWSRDDFARVQRAGMATIGFCSGNDDPAALRRLAAAWGVLLCVDVEAHIRDDGPWVQDWLDRSGAGLYGNAPVFPGRKAAFYVLAAYPPTGDPGATWTSAQPRPAGPCAWQWVGTHDEFGHGVDRGWYDDWFATGHGDRWATTGGKFQRDPVLAQNKDGRLEAVVTGEDGHLYGLAQTAPGKDWWSEWVDLGPPPGGALGNPAVARAKSGCVTLLVRSADGKVGHRAQKAPGGALAVWASMGGHPRKRDPVVIAGAGGHLCAFVIADDGGLFGLEQGGPTGAWGTTWADLGAAPPGGAAGRLAVRQHEDGRLEILLRGTNGKIFHRTERRPGGPLTPEWAVLRADPGHNDPVLARHKDGRLHAFVIGDDGRLFDIAQAVPNGPWPARWRALGGRVPGGPVGRLAVQRDGTGRLDLFVRGTDGKLYHRAQQQAGGPFAPAWTSLGGSVAGNPVVGCNTDGRLEVLAVGKDSAIHRAAQTAPGHW
jgi:hypothetical protein